MKFLKYQCVENAGTYITEAKIITNQAIIVFPLSKIHHFIQQ